MTAKTTLLVGDNVKSLTSTEIENAVLKQKLHTLEFEAQGHANEISRFKEDRRNWRAREIALNDQVLHLQDRVAELQDRLLSARSLLAKSAAA